MLEAEWVLPNSTKATSSPDANDDRGVYGVCSLVEDMLRNVISRTMESNKHDIHALWRENQSGKFQLLQGAIDTKPWMRMSYTDAIKELETYNGSMNGTAFEFSPIWGNSLASEHERFLSENVAKGPVFVTDFPLAIKPFYMRANERSGESEDPKATVACFDLLVPHPSTSELAGGSVREERLDVLERTLDKMHAENLLDRKDYEWYLDLRRYGCVFLVSF
jgi:asparaginyl-tRNA synthetase